MGIERVKKLSWSRPNMQSGSYEIDINEISNQLMLAFPGKSITLLSPFEIKMDSSIFSRTVIRFMHNNDGKYYNRSGLLTMNSNAIRWWPTIFAGLLIATFILAIPICILLFFDWIHTQRRFGNKLDKFFAMKGFIKRR